MSMELIVGLQFESRILNQLDSLLSQVLRLLEKIKRQDRGEEEMPPVTLPPLPQDERAERKRENDSIKAQRKGDKEKAEDGFLNFEGIDSDEGFLKDDELSDSDDEEIDVVDAYLGNNSFSFLLNPHSFGDAHTSFIEQLMTQLFFWCVSSSIRLRKGLKLSIPIDDFIFQVLSQITEHFIKFFSLSNELEKADDYLQNF